MLKSKLISAFVLCMLLSTGSLFCATTNFANKAKIAVGYDIELYGLGGNHGIGGKSGMAIRQSLSSQTVHQVLLLALQLWPQYNYGNLRSAYSHGDLTIAPTSHPFGQAYFVDYEGVEICVLIAI